MRYAISILGFLVLWPAGEAWAQLEPPNELGVTMGHLHLHVRDVEANKKFFQLMGGTSLTIDGTEVVKFPSVYVFLTQGTPVPLGAQRTEVFCGCPADGLESSMVNHVGFNVRGYDSFYAKFKAAGYRITDYQNARGRSFLFSPDGLMFEIAEGRTLAGPVGQLHIHTFVSDVPPKGRDHQVTGFEMYLWYAKMFGVKLTTGGPGSGLGDDLPGVRLRISQTRIPIEPTKGHVLDHIGFEVKNLEAFSQQLEANGVKFDKPYSKTRHASFASAEFTDPWGTSIELTEGLSALAAVGSGQAGRGGKIDTPGVRVLETTLQPQERTEQRERPMNRVLVFRNAGRMTRTTSGKVETLDFKAGDVRWDPAGAPYRVENLTDHPIEIVEIELRNTPKNPPLVLPPLDPPVADAQHYKIELENEQVRVLRVRYGPHEKGGLHEHVRSRVVVNLSPSLRARFGNVTMAHASTHAEENTTDQVQERLAVEMK